MATRSPKLRQRKIMGVGEIYESFITALPILSAVQFLSILTLLYSDLRPYLTGVFPSITLLKFLVILSVIMIGVMILVYRFLIPSIWTFRGKQLYGFESELMDKINNLKEEVDELKNDKASCDATTLHKKGGKK